jgi:BMFP domain-containing protein YqiC
LALAGCTAVGFLAGRISPDHSLRADTSAAGPVESSSDPAILAASFRERQDETSAADQREAPVPASLPTMSDERREDRAGDDQNERLGRRRGGFREPITPEAIDRMLEVAREIDAPMAERLESLRVKDPVEFEQAIRQAARRLLAMADLKQRDPDLYEVRVTEMAQAAQVNRVAGQLREAYARNASSSETESLENQLRSLLQVQLALSIKAKAEYLCRLEEHVQKVRDEIDQEATHFATTVEARLQALIAPETDDASDADPVAEPALMKPDAKPTAVESKPANPARQDDQAER